MTHAPVDAARIREVLDDCASDIEEWVDGHYAQTKHYPSEQRRYARDMQSAHKARALLRDIDAQDAAPAGWHSKGGDGLVQRDPAPCAARGAPTSGWRTMQIGGAPSPALHAPTVEACIAEAERIKETSASYAGEAWIADQLVKALRALTSGAEAGERPSCPYHDCKWPSCSCEEDEDDSDRGASAEPNAALRSLYKHGKDIEQNGIASAEPRPLSEWSDEELWKAVKRQKWNLDWPHGAELRSRGWLPHHGSDKAPVEGEVEVRLRNRSVLRARPAEHLQWEHENCQWDIIAYRPVPAKPEPAADAGEVERLARIEALEQALRGIEAEIESGRADNLKVGRIADIIDDCSAAREGS